MPDEINTLARVIGLDVTDFVKVREIEVSIGGKTGAGAQVTLAKRRGCVGREMGRLVRLTGLRIFDELAPAFFTTVILFAK